MANSEFLLFLQNKKDEARLDFLEAKKVWQDFGEECGDPPPMNEEARMLRLQAELVRSTAAYRKAWTEWYSAINGISLNRRVLERKNTPAFATPLPVYKLLEELEIGWDID